MAVLHITEAELARDVHAVLEKVRHGAEVVIEHDHHPIAVVRSAEPPRRTASEVLALIPKNSGATLDDEFTKDLEEIINSHREPLDPPEWD